MADDTDTDSDTGVVVMAAAAAYLNLLQVVRMGAAVVFDDDLEMDCLGADPEMGIERWLFERTADSEEDSSEAKRTRLSYPRPDYNASAWGVMLENLKNLHVDGRLDADCKEAGEFRGRFRVPYDFFLWLIDTARPWFPTATQDVARRGCIPLPLKVRVARFWCDLDISIV